MYECRLDFDQGRHSSRLSRGQLTDFRIQLSPALFNNSPLGLAQRSEMSERLVVANRLGPVYSDVAGLSLVAFVAY